jgi:hypothetical protein
MKKLTKRDLINRKKIIKSSNFNYIRLLREDYPNMPILESTKVFIDKIKQGSI